MAALGVLTGCVVTDPIDFERPANNPPQFVLDSRPSAIQLGSIQYVRAASAPSWTFDFLVRDTDVNQPLDVHWRIYTGNQPGFRKTTQRLPATGSELRELGIIVDSSGDLDIDSCHRVEIGVSSSFTLPFDGVDDDLRGFDEREDPFDYDLFTFWIWEGDPTTRDPMNLVATCDTGVIQPPATTGAGGAAGTAGEEVP
jgi:hypothetical protein